MNDDDIAKFYACVVVDAMRSRTAAHYDRVADRLEEGLSRPSDFLGRSTSQSRATREARLRSKIAACRNAAHFWRHITNETPLPPPATNTEQRTAA